MPKEDETDTVLINSDLKTVHKTLIDLVRELDKAVGKAKTAAKVKAVLDEITEMNARITIVGSQLFTQQTAAIKKRSEAVLVAVEDVKKAIKEQEKIRDFIKTVSKFLGLVDKLIDTAKLVL